MNTLSLIVIIISSILFGILTCLVAIWMIFKYYSKTPGSPEKESTHIPKVGQFHLPQVLLDILETSDTPKKETCVALNLIFHFLFHELRNSDEVRSWFLKKLTLEFEELLTRSTTGKLIDKLTIRELDLGSKFPLVTGVSVQDVQLHPALRHIETLDLSLDLQYEGGFQLGINARMLLGTTALVAIKVTRLCGRARLRFTRQPYSHWSFTFFSEPSLDLQVDSTFQGRPVPQVTSIIVSQIRKAVKKKHTLPQFKLRYKPFFLPPGRSFQPSQHEDWGSLPSGVLNVKLVECTRLHPELLSGDIYCTLAVDEAPWVELVQTDSTAVMTLDLIVVKRSSQNLGVTFRPDTAGSVVCVDHVDSGSPAFTAGIRKNDVVLSVQGVKVNALSQASKLLKAGGNRFSLRVERRRSLVTHEVKLDGDGNKSLPGSPARVRRRHISEPHNERQLGTERHSGSESSGGSSTASPSNSPAKKAEKLKIPDEARRLSCSTLALSGVQIYRTKEMPVAPDVQFNESVTFHLSENVRYFNLGVWSQNEGKDILLGHLSIPLGQVVESCTGTGLGHLIKKWQLIEPCIPSKIHQLTGHSGFEPALCYGDALLFFVLVPDPPSIPSSSPRASASHRGDGELLLEATIPSPSPAREIPTPNSLPLSPELQHPVHDFVRTHFARSTQCDFCSKKIWLKDAVQCRCCRMTCHKKCVTKCQASAVCVPCDDPLDGPSPTKAPEIVTTGVDSEVPLDAPPSPGGQGSKRSLGGLLASVASRGMKRVGSASNLAPPDMGTGPMCLSRSVPHSPQLSPATSRKASLVDASLFEMPGALAVLDEAADELRVEAALEQLLQRQYDGEDIMTQAKDTGRQLYSGLPGRKDKINKLISRLKVAMDREMQIQEALEAEAEDAQDKAQRSSLLRRSEQRVQAITVLMLHCCAGLQHVQDTEEDDHPEMLPNIQTGNTNEQSST